eukprot:TRINITY_DN13219_c0_g1_i1.p2 TRINITY_DN13219_c0_g1~~TRINITY_DN13219_c0_g1_i1.p2  ORF type:complete len:201 (+),score=32.84 TRINITY_DN13219_c0_g1_i1:228-830(+)
MIGEQRGDLMLSCTKNAHLDEAINLMKDKALSVLSSYLSYIIHSSLVNEIAISPFYTLCVSMFKIATVSLFTVTGPLHDTMEEIIEDDTKSDVLVGFLGLLAKMLEESSFFSLFSPEKERIIIDIVLNFLKCTKKEKSWIKSDPHNFVNLAADTCEKQESGICKTEAIKMLESFCDHKNCLLYTSPSPRDLSTSRMPSSA